MGGSGLRRRKKNLKHPTVPSVEEQCFPSLVPSPKDQHSYQATHFPSCALLFKLMNQVLLGTINSEFGWVWLFQPLCSYFFVSAYVWDCLLGMPWCQSGECALWNHRACVHSLAPWCEGFITDHSVPLHPHLWMGTVTVPIYRAMVMNTWMTTCNQQKELEQYLAQKYVHSIDIN